MSYDSNKTIDGLEALTVAGGDLLVLADITDSNRAKKLSADELDTYLAQTTKTLTNKTLVAPALGTPISGVATNLTGTASGLTAGTVTTNANLTGHVTSVGNAAVLGSFTLAELSTAVSDAVIARTDAGQTFTGVQTFSSDPLIPDEAYGSGWNGVLEPPTKNAVYDKIETLGSVSDAFANTPNTSETNTTWYSWTQPFISTTAPALIGFTNTFTVSGNDYGGFGHKTLSASVSGALTDKISGNGSNETYTAASSKDIKFKWRMTQGVSGSGDYLGFGFADATTTFDDVETSTAAGIRFVNNNGTLFASNGNGASNTNTNVDTGITDANWNVYEIVFNPGTDAKFYINGTLVATHTTNLPTGSLQYFGIGYTKGTNNIEFNVNPVTFSLEM